MQRLHEESLCTHVTAYVEPLRFGKRWRKRLDRTALVGVNYLLWVRESGEEEKMETEQAATDECGTSTGASAGSHGDGRMWNHAVLV